MFDQLMEPTLQKLNLWRSYKLRVYIHSDLDNAHELPGVGIPTKTSLKRITLYKEAVPTL
jgi:hypothetical protein